MVVHGFGTVDLTPDEGQVWLKHCTMHVIVSAGPKALSYCPSMCVRLSACEQFISGTVGLIAAKLCTQSLDTRAEPLPQIFHYGLL